MDGQDLEEFVCGLAHGAGANLALTTLIRLGYGVLINWLFPVGRCDQAEAGENICRYPRQGKERETYDHLNFGSVISTLESRIMPIFVRWGTAVCV